ncbi:putative phage abortive infection protein [Lactococcus petauri]|uniref:putative phage abortive infection protein n=1 Tax=Lactococcus petauri TaxID=1940789 RepID=UPI00254B1B24|nr:putative phage abortive infection protein [Lactococcus petauri]
MGIKRFLKKLFNKSYFFYFFIFILLLSFGTIVVSIYRLFTLKNPSTIENQQILTFLTGGISLFILSLTSFLSIKTSESADRRDRDHLILETFKQNYLILEKNNKRLNNYVDEINLRSKNEWVGFNKLVNYLNTECTVSSPDIEEIQKLEQFQKSTNYKIVSQYILNGKRTQIKNIARLYLKFYRKDIYQVIKDDYLDKQLSNQDEKSYVNLMRIEFFKKIDALYNNFFQEDNHKYKDYRDNISENIIESFSDINYFFRHTHRILKLLNEVDDIRVKKNFMGILRAQYSEQVILSIYLNAVYTKKGIGLAKQLLNSDFFASNDDFKNGNQMIHGAFETTFQKGKQYRIIKDLFVFSHEDRNDIKELPDAFEESFDC